MDHRCFTLNGTSEYTIIFNVCWSSDSYFNPSVRCFLRCLIKIFIILISSVWNVSFAPCEIMLRPVRISGLVCLM